MWREVVDEEISKQKQLRPDKAQNKLELTARVERVKCDSYNLQNLKLYQKAMREKTPSAADFSPNGIISKLYDRKKHVSYDIAKRNEGKVNYIYSMMTHLDDETNKSKYLKAQALISKNPAPWSPDSKIPEPQFQKLAQVRQKWVENSRFLKQQMRQKQVKKSVDRSYDLYTSYFNNYFVKEEQEKPKDKYKLAQDYQAALQQQIYARKMKENEEAHMSPFETKYNKLFFN